MVGATAECCGWDCGDCGSGGNSVGSTTGLTTFVVGSVERAAEGLLGDNSVEGRLVVFRGEFSDVPELALRLLGVQGVKGDDGPSSIGVSSFVLGSSPGAGELNSDDGDFLNFRGTRRTSLMTRTVSSLLSE